MDKLRSLRSLNDRIAVRIPPDADGFTGRECPVPKCLGYFKVKFGTGLKGIGLPCHCPYCGHIAAHDHFWTRDQIEYAKSVALSKVADAVHNDLKSMEFDIKPKGAFGIGLSMKVERRGHVPIHNYREKALETIVTCDSCTLEYAVYGVYAFCPDCGKHNSLQILEKNLDLARKELDLSTKQSDVELGRYLDEDSLENCVSAFDAFGRETCRIAADKSSNPGKAGSLSFQNLRRANTQLQAIFGIDMSKEVDPLEWRHIELCFQRRHLIAHRAGVVDEEYLRETGESRNLLGKRIYISRIDVQSLAQVLLRMGQRLFSALTP